MKGNRNKKIMGAIISSLAYGLLLIFVGITVLYAEITDPIPFFIFIIIELIILIPLIAIIYNLIVRIKEIKGGEEDEASKY